MTTKTVDGYFGPKQVTRDEFVTQWVSHFNQTLHLADNVAELEELDTMALRIKALAGAKWDRMKG